MKAPRGAIAWFAQNPVAANLVMLVLLVGGLLSGLRVKQEVFPDFKLDVIRIEVPYPGASPSESEQGVVLAIEEAVRSVDGVDRVTAAALEGAASVYVHLDLDTNPVSALSDVKNAVDRLTSLPKEAERPQISLVTNRLQVISLVLHADVDRRVLREIAETARDELLKDPGITDVDFAGAPDREIAIDVPAENLRAHSLTLDRIAAIVANTAIEVPGGRVKTRGGEVLLRTTERRHTAAQFGSIPIVTSSTGTEITLGQIAEIEAGFEDTEESAFFNGQPAIMIKVFRSGDQTPIAVASRVKEFAERFKETLPPGVSLSQWLDWSEIYQQRINLLLRNASLGLLLVMLILGLTLEIRLAFWVTMGIPISFLGALMLMPALDVSVNMISLFAFIVVLGMVVDDAIVVGENVFEARQRGVPRLEAAITGAKSVAMPVCFAISTSIAAFAPMLFVPGFAGKLYRVIPTIVISVLAISLIESLWVLPAHLGALKPPRTTGTFAAIHRRQQKIARALERFIENVYRPFLRLALKRRYLTLSIGFAILIATLGFVKGGHVPFRFMPNIPGDIATASVRLPYGSPVEETQRVQQRILAVAREILAEHDGEHIVRGVFSQVGSPLPGDPGQSKPRLPGGHLANVQVYFVPAGDRELQTQQFVDAWRQRLGRIAAAEELTFQSATGPTPGSPINVELHHLDMDVLDRASADLAATLRDFSQAKDVDDGFAFGKPQLDFRLTPQAVSLGMTSIDVARQVRHAFYGAEVLRQQEGRDEVKVMVRLPQRERSSVHDVEHMILRTPQGGEIALEEAVAIRRGRAYPAISRSEGSRIVEVTADVVPGTSPGTILTSLESGPLADLLERYPGLHYEYGGALRSQSTAMESLSFGGLLAMIAIYGLLAVPFRSYIQPIIVMVAIPFGAIGAIFGHVVMGFDLSMISVMGLVALAGVVVNDSLVLIDAVNTFRREGMSPYEAVVAAGTRRFRPILLTSLTTFFGLTPMIVETSFQARFLIPMAVSLGFGVMFATFIVLLLVPALYLAVEDLTGRATRT